MMKDKIMEAPDQSQKGSAQTRSDRVPARQRTRRAPRKLDATERDAASFPEIVAQGIVQSLYEGRVVPGQRLIEEDLGRTFNVSRVPVREALKRLASEGIVRLTPYKGAYIRTLTRKEARDVIAVAEMTFGLATRLAAESSDEPGRQLLEERYEALMALRESNNFPEYVRVSNEYGEVLYGLTDNDELLRIAPMIHLQMIRVLFMRYRSFEDHVHFDVLERINSAIIARDPAAAERAGREFMQRALSAIDKLPDAAFSAGS